MPIDSFTVLFGGLFIKAILTVLFFAFWLNDRRAVWFIWWSGSFFLGGVAALAFVMRGHWPDILTIGIGNASLLAAFGCCWQGARVFDGRAPLWLPVLLAPVVWLVTCLIPDFMKDVTSRILLSSAIAGSFITLSALEFWRGRGETLPSRWPVIVLLTSLSLVFWTRIPLVSVLPFPFGALPMHPGWLGVFNLVLFFHTIVLTVLLVAMSKERLELEQRRNAQTDPLTGALNRRAFGLRAARLVQRHQADNQALCLIGIDLDQFKMLNDQHGHAGGDRVLVRAVEIMQDSIRPTDLLFRMGGDEFCCLLPAASRAEGQQVAARIRFRVEAAGIMMSEAGEVVTVSIGVACTDHSGFDVDALMRDADRAVYEAKGLGRNRVIGPPGSDLADLAENSAGLRLVSR